MNKFFRLTACSLLAAYLANFSHAQTASGPPDWNDKASVYLSRTANEQIQPPGQTGEGAPVAQEPAVLPAPEAVPLASAEQDHATGKVIVDTAVVPAANEQTLQPAAPLGETSPIDNRRLAPPSSPSPSTTLGNSGGSMSAAIPSRRMIDFGIPTKSLYTIGSALAIVIGAFLLFAHAMRRSSQKSAGRSQLPSDVVSVLGRVPLATRQFAELLRVGNKLVLVSLTPGGAETLTEVTDPAEVDRLVGLCQQKSKNSTTQAFEQVFQQMSSEPSTGGFLGTEPMPSFAAPTSAYRANRGGSQRA